MSPIVVLLVCGLSVWVVSSTLLISVSRLIEDLSYLYQKVGIDD